MKNPFLKFLTYIFVICLILAFIIGTNGTQPWTQIVNKICVGICFFIGFIYLLILIYCVIENKIIDKCLKTNNYDQLLKYCKKKIEKKSFILNDRKSYYKYLTLLSYFSLNEKDNIENCFKEFDEMDSFPITYYWKASYLISINQYDEVEALYNKFVSSNDMRRKAYQLQHIFNLFNSFRLFALGQIKEAKEALENVDTSKISMPSSLKAIDMIKNAVINEEIVEVIDINIEE